MASPKNMVISKAASRNTANLTDMEDRYERQIMLDEIGPGGQQKLLEARVLVIGAGGLGSPVSMYLAAAGVGHIGLADEDSVSISNLQRQVLYSEDVVGMPKAKIAAGRLSLMNKDVEVKPIICRVDSSNVSDLISDYDIVADCCDNYSTRVIVSNACIASGKVYVYAAIQGFEGQVSVFDNGTARYTDLFPEPPAEPAEAVIGMTAGITGCVQAHEVVKLICGYGQTLRNKLWTIDISTMQSNIIEL